MSDHNRNGTWLLYTSAAALLGPMISVGCAAPLDEAGEPVEIEGPEQALEGAFDGETLLRGVFFGVGPAADLLPEIWAKKPLSKESAARAFREGMSQFERSREASEADEKVAEIIKSKEPRSEQVAVEISNLAIAQIAEQDPAFIRQFQKSIYSADPVRVSDAIEEAGRRFSEILQIDALRDPGRYGADYLFNENVAVNINAVLNVNVAVNVDTAYNKTQFWSRDFLDRESMLRSQVVIAQITERFANQAGGGFGL